jgi:hypothetical protein
VRKLGPMSAQFASRDGVTGADVVRLSRLELRVGYPAHDPDPDFVGVTILVDGKDLLARAGPRGPYRGPWPPALLGDESPLIPADPPRRISLYFEGTMHPDEGNITAIISDADRHVIWADFRECPADATIDPDGMMFDLHPATSTALRVPDLVFDREQYMAEVRRASAERDWESDRWRTAELLQEYLCQAIRDRPGQSDEDFYPCRCEPADDDAGFLVTFWDELDPRHGLVVALTADPGTPEQRARSMTNALLGTPTQQWPVVHRIEQSGEDAAS